MLDIIVASILIAFGILVIYFSIEEGIEDEKLLIVLLIGIVCVGIGAWILIVKITLAVILKKIAGFILAGLGLFLVIGFPDIKDYQSFGMGRAGIFIGLILLIIGAWLLFF